MVPTTVTDLEYGVLLISKSTVAMNPTVPKNFLTNCYITALPYVMYYVLVSPLISWLI